MRGGLHKYSSCERVAAEQARIVAFGSQREDAIWCRGVFQASTSKPARFRNPLNEYLWKARPLPRRLRAAAGTSALPAVEGR